MLFKWTELYKHMLKMQINSKDYGWFGVVEAAAEQRSAPSPFARAPIINNSCPCYVNPGLESTSPQIPLILQLLPAVHSTRLKSLGVLRGPPLLKQGLISVGSAIIGFMAAAYRWLPECSSDSCTSPSVGCPCWFWRPLRISVAHWWWSSWDQTS